jgi:hypothetical protein
MNKVAIRQYATNEYNRQQYNIVLTLLESAVNAAADGRLFPAVSTSISYTVNQNNAVILADASAGAVTISLPPAREMEQKRITVKKIDSSGNAVTVDADGAETIDGAANKAISSQYVSHDFVSFNGAWWII